MLDRVQEVVVAEYASPTFMDIKNRDWALRTPEAKALRRYVVDEKNRPDIWRDLETTFLQTGLESVEAKRMLEWFHDNSCITRSVRKRPSDAEPFDQIYRYSEPKCAIDKFYIQSKGAIGIHLRLLALIDRLPDIIRDGIKKADLKVGEKFRILDVGCGYGDAIREVLVRNRDLAEKVMVYGVDIDERSTQEFQKRVDRDNLSSSFVIVAKDMLEFASIKAHLILVIGMLCPTRSKICIQVLSGLQFHAAPGSMVIYSTVQIPMIKGDPLLNVFMRGMKWFMDFKTEQEARRIGTEAGWRIIGHFDDALGYNRMSIGVLA